MKSKKKIEKILRLNKRKVYLTSEMKGVKKTKKNCSFKKNITPIKNHLVYFLNLNKRLKMNFLKNFIEF